MTIRILECVKCGEADRFDTWPGADDDDVLDQLIRSESWTFDGADEICPGCSEVDDDE